jgi:drug/metabolite transporter (DMT)-like permease
VKKTDFLLLTILSAIWGASFLFMRIASPEFGPVALICVRMTGAVIIVLPFLLSKKFRARVASHAGRLTLLGITNHVIPFTLLAFATTRLEAGFTSLINATTPMFTAIAGAALFATAISRSQIVGLAIAFFGVFILSFGKLSFTAGGAGWAILAGLGATFCYGISVNYSKRHLSGLSASEITVGSMLASTLILLLPGWWFWPEVQPSQEAWISAILLATVCTAIAFLLFFRVLASAGAIASSTVTFLVPVFAIGWGISLLGESLNLQLIIGMLVTLLGTAITLGLIRLNNLNSAG